ncbi:MAG: contractile injection system tape measure protein [Bacteroidota bacterium]
MTVYNHIIHRINLDIEAPPGTDGHRLQDRVLHILYDQILPEIGKELDELDLAGRHIRIGELNLDLGDMGDAGLEEELPLKMRQQLFMRIKAFSGRTEDTLLKTPESRLPSLSGPIPREQDDTVHAESLTPERQMLDILIHYLKTGQLPWYCDGSSMAPAGQAVTGALYKLDAGDRDRLKNLLSFDSKALSRLILQYDSPVAGEVLTLLLAPSAGMKMDTLKKGVAKLTKKAALAATPEVYLHKIGQLLKSPRFSEAALEVREKEMPSGLDTQPLHHRLAGEGDKLKKKPDLLQENSGTREKLERHADHPEPVRGDELPEEGLLVTHAGLILLHPFLEYFFREFGLLEGDRFRDGKSRLTAAQMLGYLATGEDNLYEYDLLFEKYLCGISRDTPVLRKSLLTAEMKRESGNLLKAVIRHWKELKNTSPDGLRQGFLIRRGKLVTGSFGHRLLVEKATQDILLSWLPWGIGVIKLPWLSEIMHVEWN